jgi:Ca-activated chloride channel family protein
MDALRFYLKKLDTLVLPTRGSNPAAALDMAASMLADKHQPLPGLVLWLTDGDFSSRQIVALKNTVDALKQASLPLYILGIGTEDGEAIPLANGKWLEHQGNIVRSKLNSSLLQALAERGKGRYSPVKNDESDWQVLYQDGIANAFPARVNDDAQQWHALFIWALIPAVLLFFLLVGMPRNTLHAVILLGFASSFSMPGSSFAADKENLIKNAMVTGIEAYRAGQFDKAIKSFSQAVFDAKTDAQRGRALYNLGNSYFQQGDYLAAIQLFKDSLRYRKNHLASRQNLELSETVQSALQQRLAQLRALRMLTKGENKVDGNRLEAIGNELNWDQESTKTSGHSMNQKADALPALPIDKATLKQLLDKGLKRLVQQGVTSLHDKIRRQQSLSEAQIAMQEMDDNPAIFWKRLFEIEEGFPGSLDKPKEIPGVQPW